MEMKEIYYLLIIYINYFIKLLIVILLLLVFFYRENLFVLYLDLCLFYIVVIFVFNCFDVVLISYIEEGN